MRRFVFLAAALAAGGLAITEPGFASAPIEPLISGQIPTLAPIVKKVAPAVVSIAVRTQIRDQQAMPFDDTPLRQMLGIPEPPPNTQNLLSGSGVLFDGPRGLIVTNSHVVENADQITVTLADGRQVGGVLQGSDTDTDIALIRIAPQNVPQIAFADSDRLEVGDYVLAIGNPFGIGQTVTSGIISGVRRTEMGLERYEDFIQTDASINPGNSGGALVNLRGEVVGINAAIVGTGAGSAGIGFAIPIDMVRAIADQLVRYGFMERGDLGFSVASLRDDLAKKYDLPPGQAGAVVTRMEAYSAAERAGLRLGDLVTSIGTSAVRSAADLRNKLGLLRVGDPANLTIWRGGKTLHVQAVVPEPEIKTVQGAEISPLFDGALIARDEWNADEKGLQVTTVKSGSAAWQSGMREGDVITSVNLKRVSDFDRLAEELAKTPERVVLNVTRNGEHVVLSISSKGYGPLKSAR